MLRASAASQSLTSGPVSPWRHRRCRGLKCAAPRGIGSGRPRCPGLLLSTSAQCWRAIRTTASAARAVLGGADVTLDSETALCYVSGNFHRYFEITPEETYGDK